MTLKTAPLLARFARGAVLFGILAGCQSSAPPANPAMMDNAPKPQTQTRPVAVTEKNPETEIARARPERIYPEPEALHGLDEKGLISILGQPQFIRRDQPAKIWQYRGAVCTLDIFLYQEAAGLPYAVNYIETRNTQSPALSQKTLSQKNCIVSILKERDTPTS